MSCAWSVFSCSGGGVDALDPNDQDGGALNRSDQVGLKISIEISDRAIDILVAPMMNTSDCQFHGTTSDEDVLFLAFIPSISVCRVSCAKGVFEITDKNLVEDSIPGSPSVTAAAATTRFSYGVQLVEEHDARSSGTCLVKDIANVGFGFSKPHGKELRALNGNKVGLTFVGNACNQRFSNSRELYTHAFASSVLPVPGGP